MIRRYYDQFEQAIKSIAFTYMQKAGIVIDTKYLNYVIAIAEQKSITKAAQFLSISQPTLSQYLAKLEEELGTPLFHRHSGELYPTPSGTLYLTACRDVRSMHQKLCQDISLLVHSEHIRIAASVSWALKLLCGILPVFKERFPNSTVEFSEENQRQIKIMVNEGVVDLALLASTSLNGLAGNTRILGQEEILFAAHKDHPFCREFGPERAVVSEDFLTYFSGDNFILAAEHSNIRRIEEEIFSQINFFPSSSCCIKHMQHAATMAANQFGVTLVPSSCAVASPDIRYYHLKPQRFRMNFISTQPDRPLTPGENALIELIQEHYPEYQKSF